MISDFELRLAEVLGASLPAPFAGRVQVAPGTPGGGAPRIVLGVERAEVLPSAMGDAPEAVVPGDAGPRRILRARCTVRLQVIPSGGGGRAQERAGLDAAAYALDAPGFRNGRSLSGGAPDPGFLLQRLQVREAALPFEGEATFRQGVILEAEGWFWPVGAAGQAGVQIREAQIRGVVLPLSLTLAAPLAAGGAAVPMTLGVRSGRLAAVGEGDGAAPALRLALRLVALDGAPGAGTLTGAADGLLLVDVADDAASFTYQPPPDPTREQLVVALDDGEEGAGQELARFLLAVEEGA